MKKEFWSLLPCQIPHRCLPKKSPSLHINSVFFHYCATNIHKRAVDNWWSICSLSLQFSPTESVRKTQSWGLLKFLYLIALNFSTIPIVVVINFHSLLLSDFHDLSFLPLDSGEKGSRCIILVITLMLGSFLILRKAQCLHPLLKCCR